MVMSNGYFDVNLAAETGVRPRFAISLSENGGLPPIGVSAAA